MNTKSNLRQFNIEGGPNVDRILDGFKYAYDKSVSIPVNFVVAKSYTAPRDKPGCAFAPLEMRVSQIVSVSHESGNDTSLNIAGNCEVALGEEKRNISKYQSDLILARFEAYYDAKTRKGVITFFI